MLQLSIAIGLYLVIAGGIQGIVAALVALGSRNESVVQSRQGLRGWSSTSTETPGVPPTPPAMPDVPAPPPGSVPNDGGEPLG
jgi:hypothetical protein